MSPERYARLKQTLDNRQLDLTVVMENVHKPHNFAAIVRSCEAAGVAHAHAMVQDGHMSKHIHTSAGSSKWVKVDSYNNIDEPFDKLRGQGYQLSLIHI